MPTRNNNPEKTPAKASAVRAPGLLRLGDLFIAVVAAVVLMVIVVLVADPLGVTLEGKNRTKRAVAAQNMRSLPPD